MRKKILKKLPRNNWGSFFDRERVLRCRLADLDWSEWKLLGAVSFSEMPREPGIHRIRQKNEERDHLEYTGESGDARRRIQSLARGVFPEEMPYRDLIRQLPAFGQFEMTLAMYSTHTTPAEGRE